MKLDENKILDEIQKLSSQGLSRSDTLFELLGGEHLNKIFDQDTVDSIMRSFVENSQLHPCIDGIGVDILEGLLNGEIVGDIEEFYNIRPEYILELSPAQQKVMAKALAGSNKSQEELLVIAWENGLKTCACGGESVRRYMMFEVDADDAKKVAIMQQISKTCGIKPYIFYMEGKIEVTFYDEDKSDGEFYSKISNAISMENQPDLFTTALLKNVENNENFNRSIIKGKENEIQQMSETLEETLEENIKLQTENKDLKERLANIKEWITKRLAKIPLVGRAILRSMEKEENLLQEKNEVER